MPEYADYDSGLFGCFDDPGLCFKYWCLPCCAVGWNAKKARGDDGMDVGFCIGSCFCYNIFSFIAHQRVVDYLKIDEGLGTSCLKACCCNPCMQCQDARAMENKKPIPRMNKMKKAEEGAMYRRVADFLR